MNYEKWAMSRFYMNLLISNTGPEDGQNPI